MTDLTHTRRRKTSTEALPSTALHPAPVAICTLDNTYKLLWFNSAAAALFALNKSDCGTAYHKLIRVFVNGLEQTAEQITRAKRQLERGVVLTGPYQFQNKNGNTLFLSATFTPTLHNNAFAGITAVFQDMAAAAVPQAAKAEREQLQLLYNLSSITSHAVFILNAKQRVLFWNKGSEILFRARAAQVLLKKLGDGFAFGLSKTRLDPLLAAAKNAGHAETNFIQAFADGPPKTFDLRVSFLAGNAPAPDSFLVTCYDTTPARNREKILADFNQSLKLKVSEHEHQLSDAQQRLQYHLSNTPLGIIEWRDRRVIAWSKQAEAILGWTAAEALGKTGDNLHLVVPNDRDVAELQREVFETSTMFAQGVIRNLTKAGQVVYCHWYNSILRDEHGAVSSILTFVQNVTDRVLTEEKLKRQEQYLSTIYDTVTDLVFLLDVEPDDHYRFVSVNQSFVNITGMPAAHVVGRCVHEVRPKAALDEVFKQYRKAIAEKRTVTWEAKTTYPSGHKTGMLTITPVFDGSGSCVQLVGSVHDITERVTMEAAYKQMYMLVQSSTNYITILRGHTERNCAFLNEAGRRMVGLENRDVDAFPLDHLIGAEEQRRLKPAAEAGQGTFSAETRFIHQKTGLLIPVMLNVFRINNLEGEPLFAGIATDLRDIKNVQKELEAANNQLRGLAAHLQEVREVERLGIAREIHDELGQLLTAAKMDLMWAYGQLKKNPAAAAEKLEGALSLMDASIEGVRKIVSNLRPALLEDLGLTEALRWQMQQFAAKTGIKTQFSTNEEEPKLPEKISLALFRICQEALTNVQRYANASVVTLRLRLEDGVMKMLIRDNGVGFDPSAKPSKKSFGLLGMKERVLMCGGEMQLQSAPEKGTAINVQIPMVFHE